MRTKDITLLLIPSALFVVLAVTALFASGYLLHLSEHELFTPQERQRVFEEFITKVRSGELQLTPEQIIERERSSHELQIVYRNEHASIARSVRWFGWVGLIGAVLQVYVVLRVKAEHRRPDA